MILKHFNMFFAWISTVFQHFLRAFPLLREAMESLISTSQPLNLSTSQPLNLSGGVSTSQPAFRLYSSTACAFLLHFYRAPALFSVRIPTVFQHWVRAFLLICSTLCMHFFACLLHWDWFGLLCLCAHFYCVPALSACISIALQHSLHAFLLYPSTIFQHCMRAFP